jgi:glycerol-3-phosphate dehydrogenase (NAD(P)+)
MKIAVLGAGAWGTALAIAFARRHPVMLWARDPAQASAMAAQRQNPRYLAECSFPDGLSATSDFLTATAGAELLLLAAPLAGLRSSLEQLRSANITTPFLWVCKGLEAGTGLLPHQVVAEVMGKVICGALTGPSFAQEVARGMPTAITLASTDGEFATRMVRQLHGGNLRLYANDDLVGAEVGGAVKNVLAIATGICDGLGLGLNARAALITRGLAEITRFGVALGAKRDTFMGLAGLGDLILTATGDLSRNRRVGLLLAQGKALPQIVAELGHVAEGVPAAREVARRAQQLGVDMPITRVICAVLDGQLTPAQTVDALMTRDPTSE